MVAVGHGEQEAGLLGEVEAEEERGKVAPAVAVGAPLGHALEATGKGELVEEGETHDASPPIYANLQTW